MWECGLKQIIIVQFCTDVIVTPYVGVWIETINSIRSAPINLSLLMWECGLKPVS